ncbi:hypothetical protein ACRTDU_03955 [Sunxiuqinia elliptica]
MSLLDNPLVKNLIKSKLPEIIDNLDDLQEGITAYINSFDLRENETHIAIFTEETVDTLFFCIGAFRKKTMVRLIEAKPAKEFVKQLITTALKTE